MSNQSMLPQAKNPKSIWTRLGRSIIAILVILWCSIAWLWRLLIFAILLGVLGNAVYTLLTTSKIDLKGTLAALSWLTAHLVLSLAIIIPVAVLTLCSYLAHRQQQQTVQKAAQMHHDSLIVGAKADQRPPEELNAMPASTSPKSIWNIPYRRNPFFIGREDLLTQLHTNLTTIKKAALTQAQAISGLGGIGKTQIAIEYAYRHREEYHAVLWMNATTRDTLLTSCTELAALLCLPERAEQDQNLIVAAVKQWFTTHDSWLLIVDNADDLPLVEAFLPAGGNGHLLLTTRAYAPGTLAHGMEVEKMDLQGSLLLLLRRARVLPLDASVDQARASDRAAAETIAREMDGLPLAIDQAGAYIEETQASLSSYLHQYQQHLATVMRRRGGTGKDHPEPVATTWSLSFESVERIDPLAADLLRFCAFLAPDAIPEQLIVDAASELGSGFHGVESDPALLNEAFGTLLRYSLVKRKRDEQTITVHRLVQAIIKINMEAATQQAWAERTVRALNKAFPVASEYRNWPRCQQYLPHAQDCVSLIDRWKLTFPEAGRLLNQTAYYLHERGQFTEANPLYQRAIAIGEQMLGPEHPDLATRLNNLAFLYYIQGKYEQAEPLYQRAIAIGEKLLGPEHPDLATWLNNLASLYHYQGKIEQAVPLFQRAIAIAEKALGYQHPMTKHIRKNYAHFLRDWCLDLD